jgi:cAMP-binding proteins - catabolite gene activator and regulatory subunit of cAMP-dependent protein kinases
VLFIIKRGRIRLHHITPDGRSVTTAVLGPGTVFGEMDILGLRMRGTWAEAFEPSELCLMSRTDVHELLFTDPRIALRITEQLSARIADLEDRLTDLTCKTLTERLAATRHQLARHTPDEPIRLTHQQLQ